MSSIYLRIYDGLCSVCNILCQHEISPDKHKSLCKRCLQGDTIEIETYSYPRIECYRCGYEDCFEQNGYEYGVHYYYRVLTDTGQVVCRECEDYVPRRSVCRTCKTIFDSRNKLFRHLKEENHYV